MRKRYLIALTTLFSVLLILTGCSDESDTKATSSDQ
ncbi:TPA_asm: adhesin, partial [Listeria monocytogenes]|nr:adhesin [Listeria monocytogenes]